MDSERYQKIKEIFNQAVELDGEERAEFLAENCPEVSLRAEVEKMLEFSCDDDEDAFEKNAFEFYTNGSHHKIPEKIGNYRILREIGRGGMGAVYEAVRETDNFKQRVALKIIKRGMDTDAILSRFRHEQQILSSLEHPHIARFLDGGMTGDGLPFYAMEYVEGTFIDDYCNENELSLEAKLKLFRQICAAVQYAHQNLVIHRDLKPSNILVTKDESIKLLDFGIGKILTPESENEIGTATELGMMTPAYASPEQIRGERIGTASDIYSLGVILYELLTGQKPYIFKSNRPDEAVKAICESEPIRPSSVVSGAERWSVVSKDTKNNEQRANPKSKIQNPKLLRGDLDNIILKALQKEPERRYASVEQFSEDIRRHLTGLPVLARSDTFSYRTSKFIKRNKASVVTVSIIFLALVGGMLGTAFQWRIAQSERDKAEKRFGQVRKLANNVVFKYHDAIANLPGATETREMLVKDAIEYLDNLAQDAEDNPELQHELAQAYTKIGNIQGATYKANLGDSDGAVKSYEKSIEVLEKLLKRSPQKIEYLQSYFEANDSKTLLLVRLNRWSEAQKSGEKILEVSRKMAEIEPDNLDFQIKVVRSYQTMGDVVNFAGGNPASIEWYQRALTEAEKNYAKHPQNETVRRNVIVPLQRIGTKSEYEAEILKELGESSAVIAPIYLEAEKYHRRSKMLAESLKRDFPNNEIYSRYIAAININLGTALARIGKGEEGLPLIKSSCEMFAEVTENDPKNYEAKRDVAECLQYLAFAYDAMTKPPEAIEANQKALKILEEITVKDPTNFEFLAQAHLIYNNTGDIFIKTGKLSEALDVFQKGMNYVEKMSKLNSNTQIEVLRSESNRKIGEAYLAIMEKSKNEDLKPKIRDFLDNAKQDLLNLRQKNELGKNYEHKLILIERDLNRIAN